MLPNRLPTRQLLSRLPSPILQQPLRRLEYRYESTYQPPTPQPQPQQPPPRSGSDRHRDFYKTFGRPLAKNFLIAVATYQILYFTWLKLESYETKKEGEGEVKAVEGELRGLVGGREGEGR